MATSTRKPRNSSRPASKSTPTKKTTYPVNGDVTIVSVDLPSHKMKRVLSTRSYTLAQEYLYYALDSARWDASLPRYYRIYYYTDRGKDMGYGEMWLENGRILERSESENVHDVIEWGLDPKTRKPCEMRLGCYTTGPDAVRRRMFECDEKIL